MIDISKISKLANIKLTDKEKQAFTDQLNDIIKFVSHLDKADTSGATDEYSSNHTINIFSEDDVRPSFTDEQSLSNTKSKYNGYFKVDIVLKNKKLK